MEFVDIVAGRHIGDGLRNFAQCLLVVSGVESSPSRRKVRIVLRRLVLTLGRSLLDREP